MTLETSLYIAGFIICGLIFCGCMFLESEKCSINYSHFIAFFLFMIATFLTGLFLGVLI